MEKLLSYTCLDRFAKNHLLFLLTLLLSCGLCFSGYNKATMFWMMIMGFDGYGLPVWFMAFLGMTEICGAISLYLKRWAFLGAIGMSTILTAASGIHIMNGDEFKIGGMAWIMTPLMFLVTYYHYRSVADEMIVAQPA